MAEPLHLPSELSIYNVGELHVAWMGRRLADPGSAGIVDDLLVHAERVDQIDAAGVQLLLSLRRLVVSQGAVLRFVDPSAILVAACAALGASALLVETAS